MRQTVVLALVSVVAAAQQASAQRYVRQNETLEYTLTVESGGGLVVPVDYEITAMPLVVSLLYTALPGTKTRVNVFGGLGALLAAESQMRLLHNHGVLIPVTIASRKTAPYVHAGVEGEYMVHPRFAVNLRALGRLAKTSELEYDNEDFEVYQVPESKLKGRNIDFSGYNVAVGVRAYVGY